MKYHYTTQFTQFHASSCVALLMHIQMHVWRHMKQARSVTCLVIHKLIHNHADNWAAFSKQEKIVITQKHENQVISHLLPLFSGSFYFIQYTPQCRRYWRHFPAGQFTDHCVCFEWTFSMSNPICLETVP